MTSALAYIMGHWGAEGLYKLSFIPKCSLEDCFGNLLILKITFGGVIFHLLQALLTLGVKDVSDTRSSIQNGWWPIKIFLWAGLIIAAVFIPNPFYIYYGWFAVFAAAIFVIYQLLLIVSLAHDLNEYLVGQMETSDEKKWLVLLVASTITAYLISLTAHILIWALFSSGENCSINIGFAVVNLALCALASILSVTPSIQEKNEYSSSLFTSSIVTLYATYLVWSAVFSEPTDTYKCNPFDSNGGFTVTVILGAIITLFAVAWSTMRAASSEESKELGDVLGGSSSPPTEDSKATEQQKLLPGDSEDHIGESGPPQYNYSLFHVIFAFGLMYIGCLLTNWQTLSSGGKGSTTNVTVDESIVSVWVKVASSWLVIALYTWTVVNSAVCPNRKFR